MQFLIRDDDTCAFTQPHELIRCYDRYWNDFPISLAITPFRIPVGNVGVPDSLLGSTDALPLESNSELVDFLREHIARGRIHVALHGFHHVRIRGLPEYVGGDDLYRKTREGKNYLESLLRCRINTFVPPNNAVGKNGLRAIVSNGLNIINTPSLLSPRIRSQPWRNLAKFAQVQVSRRVRGMRYPYVLRFRNHAELAYHSVTPSQSSDRLIREFHLCKCARGTFVLATHYHAFDRCLQTGETVGEMIDFFIGKALAHKEIVGVGCSDVW